MPCDACNAIQIHKRGAPGHNNLERVGPLRQGVYCVGQAGITLTDFVCKDCGENWTYEDDCNDNHAGWRKTN